MPETKTLSYFHYSTWFSVLLQFIMYMCLCIKGRIWFYIRRHRGYYYHSHPSVVFKRHYYSLQIFPSFHWLRAHKTRPQVPSNNGLLMCTVIQLCLTTNNILLKRKWYHAFLLVEITLSENNRLLLFLKIFAIDKSRYFVITESNNC